MTQERVKGISRETMGSCNSCPFHSTSKSAPSFEGVVRVVHLDGYVEHFHYPIAVGHLIGDSPRHVVLTPLQLLSTGFIPMKDDTLLQPGHIYFLLPYSALKADVSPHDLSTLVRKLTAKAKGSGKMPDEGKKPDSPARTTPSWLEGECCKGMGRGQRSVGGRSWKPLLDTIREKSFNRRSESDLQEDQVPPF